MKKIAFQIILWCCLSAVAVAQRTERPATVATPDGNTYTGRITALSRYSTPNRIKMRSSNGRTYTFNNQQIKGLEIIRRDDRADQYERRLVSKQRFSNERAASDTQLVQVLVAGPYMLHQRVDKQYRSHFYLGVDSNSLRKRPVLQNPSLNEPLGYSEMLTKKNFRERLQSFAPTCNYLRNDLKKAKFNQKDLRALVATLNECAGHTPRYQWRPEEKKLELWALAGAAYTHYQMEDGLTLRGGDPYVGDYTPVLGIGILQYVADTRERVGIYGEALLRTNKASQHYIDKYGISPDFDQKIAIQYVRTHLMVRLYLPYIGQRFYWQGGIANGFALNNQNQITEYYAEPQKPTVIRIAPRYEKIPNWEFGFVSGVGMRWGPFTLEGRYDWGNGFTRDYAYSHSKSHVFSALLAYSLLR